MKFTSQILSSADESLNAKKHLLLLWDGLLVALHIFVFIHITSEVKPANISLEFRKNV